MSSMMRNGDITDYKFVIAVNKTIPIGVAMNAIGHMSLGLMRGAQEAAGVLHTTYLNTMTGGSYVEQLEKTRMDSHTEKMGVI